MAITGYTQTRAGNITRVTVTSDLSPPAGGVIYYHWYLDGGYQGVTRSSSTTSSKTFMLDQSEHVRIVCQDSLDANYDAIANAPVGYPARRTIEWVRSVDPAVARYLVTQIVGVDIDQVANLPALSGRWQYRFVTPPLADLTSYTWRIAGYDAAGNAGNWKQVGAEKIVHTPNAPRFTVSFDAGTTRVTFAEAA